MQIALQTRPWPGRFRRARPVGLLGVLGVVAVGLAACGSSGSASAGSPTTTAAGATATTAGGSGASTGGLDVSKLGSLTNYAGTMTDNGQTISVSVHSPTDWQETLGAAPTPALYIGGSTYGKSINAQGQPVWYQNPAPAAAYQQSPYPGAVQQFTGLTKVYGATIVRGAPCAVAGISGHTWTVKSPDSPGAHVGESACVADQSGALLSFDTSAGGSAVPATGLAYSYTMTGVGGVASIPVPSPVQAG